MALSCWAPAATPDREMPGRRQERKGRATRRRGANPTNHGAAGGWAGSVPSQPSASGAGLSRTGRSSSPGAGAVVDQTRRRSLTVAVIGLSARRSSMVTVSPSFKRSLSLK